MCYDQNMLARMDIQHIREQAQNPRSQHPPALATGNRHAVRIGAECVKCCRIPSGRFIACHALPVAVIRFTQARIKLHRKP